MVKGNVGCFEVVCLLALFMPRMLCAEERTVDLDAAKTKISFVLSDVLHTVHGTFRLKEGHISFDPDTNAITGDIVVDATSGNSGSQIRDKRMTRNILEAQRYPEIRFAPSKLAESIPATGSSAVKIEGSFLIHGDSHKITIPMQIQIFQQEIIATGKFVVPYVQWGMKNPSTLFLKVNEKVEIDVTALGHLKGSHTP